MKETLQYLRARWLMFSLLMLCGFGAKAQDTWYVFDTFVEDGAARFTLGSPDAEGNYVFDMYRHADAKNDWFVFANTPNPTSDAATATFLGSSTTGRVTVPMCDEEVCDLVEISYDIAYADKGAFELQSGFTWIVTFNPTTMKVKFAPKAPDALYVCNFNKTFAKAENDGTGVYTFTEFTVESEYPSFGFINTETTANPTIAIGSVPYAEASAANMVDASNGGEFTWAFTEHDAIYNDKGCFTLSNGVKYNAVLDWNAKTVVFTLAENGGGGSNQDAPATLYLCDYQKSYASADNDGTGKYVFESFTVTNSTFPRYGFTNNSNPEQASIVIGTVPYSQATSANNAIVTAEGGEFAWEFSEYRCIYDEVGCFDIPTGVELSAVLDWNTKTVTFSKPEVNMPSRLYLLDYTKSYGEALNDGNGIYKFEDVTPASAYPYYGFGPAAIPAACSWVLAAADYATAASSAAHEHNIEPTLGVPYEYAMTDPDVMNAEKCSFVLGKTAIDITLDWNAGTVTFSQKQHAAPDTLWLGYGSHMAAYAVNNGSGLYTFSRLSLGEATYGFYNAPNGSEASIVVGASISGSDVEPENGRQYSWKYVDNSTIVNAEGGFALAAGYYDVTLDWNAGTVSFGEATLGKAPDALYLVDFQYDFGEAQNNGSGIFTFSEVVVPDNQYPYYGFADDANIKDASVIVSAVPTRDATRQNNVTIATGETYNFYLATFDQIDACEGSFVIEAGCYDITVDWNAGTVKFAKPVIAAPEKLFATDTYLEDIAGSCTGDGSGIFEMVLNVNRANALVVFTSSTDLKNAEEETLYYGTQGGPVSKVEYGVEYQLCKTDYNSVWGDLTGLRLQPGRYKAIVNFPAGTVSVHDISRGDIWVVPDTLGAYDDDLHMLAPAQKLEDGVFLFSALALDKATKVVFTDNPTSQGKFFGSSMNSEASLQVRNFRTYDLYIPSFQDVNLDGFACFELAAGTWNIKVDFNEKTATFEDPQALYYPDKLALVQDGTTTDNVADGYGKYVYKLELAGEAAVSFTDPLTSRTYGPASGNVTVSAGASYPLERLTSGTAAYTVAAGTWEVVADLKAGSIAFYEYQPLTFVSSTMADGDAFYSYFGAGTNPRLDITFSANPYYAASAFIALGDWVPGVTASNDSCTIEQIGVYRNGYSLFADFSGKVRSLPEGATRREVALVINTITSVNGMPLETEQISGLPAGSLLFTFKFEDYQPIAIESHLLKADGTAAEAQETVNVDETQAVTLMVKPYSLITFDGVSLTSAADSTASLSAEWSAGAEDAEGFTPLTVKVPMAIRGTGEWTLALTGLAADDNTEHSGDVAHLITTLEHPADSVVADPASGSIVSSLRDVVLTWSHPIVSSVGYEGASEPELTVTGPDGAEPHATLQVLSVFEPNQLQIHFDEKVVGAGTYTIVIPAGTVLINDEADTGAKALSFTYTVDGSEDPTTSLAAIIASNPDAETTVCTVSGIVLRHGRAADVLRNLTQGYYIINGVKIYIP